MTDPREEALLDLYRAFNARDIDAALEHLAPDVDWPNAWKGGRLSGRAAVRAYWERQWKEIDPRVEPTAIAVEPDGSVRVRVHQLVRAKDGTVLDDRRLEHVYDFDGPFIRRMTVVDAPPDDEDDDDD